MRKIELLAPAKDLEHGRAALLCGADALYVGAPRFGARAAAGVGEDEIAELCRLAHSFGARVYVAMNTLIYPGEIAEAERIARRMWEAGADALIVQDMAFLRMNIQPVELHASTQTFNMEPEQVAFLAHAGFSRIILERALHIDEIRAIERLTAPLGVELEAFIHGAICVGNSGRCFLSRSVGPRSGNRGDCSQACRLPYNLLDERLQPISRNRHLLSVQDLNLTGHLARMIDAGIDSFKIEGRLKDINYVKNSVSWYRRELDGIINSRSDLVRSSQGTSSIEFTPAPEKSFSRGGTSYFLTDKRNRVASFDTPKAIGEPVGTIASVRRDYIELDAPAPLANGDGICFIDARGELRGTNINKTEGNRVYPNRMDEMRPGTALFRNFDARFTTALAHSRTRRAIAVTARVEVTPDTVTLTFSYDHGTGTSIITTTGTAVRTGSFDTAQHPARAEETIRTQIAKTGNTIYNVSNIEISWDTARFVPISLLGELKREAAENLTADRLRAYTRTERRPEEKAFPYPAPALSGEANVTNPLAEQFYRDHGVREIEPGYDLQTDLTGKQVMQTRYCLRRETGQCLRERPAYTGKLFIENGLHLYELQFDCVRCAMNVIYRGQHDK